MTFENNRFRGCADIHDVLENLLELSEHEDDIGALLDEAVKGINYVILRNAFEIANSISDRMKKEPRHTGELFNG